MPPARFYNCPDKELWMFEIVEQHSPSGTKSVEVFSDAEWSVYRTALEAAQARKVPFALGGGFAFSMYARRWRDTKDIDVYILPQDRETMMSALSENGFEDLHAVQPYDRKWIYRSHRDGLIVDIIWAMANQRATTDLQWLTSGPTITIRGLSFHVLPPEELIWTKLYVVQRDRSDWPDLLSILYVQGPGLDWGRLFARLGDDARLLGGLLNVFVWMCPAKAREFPAWIWERVGLLPLPDNGVVCRREPRRVGLLDMRDWFGPRDDK
jgi:hypothetical protein